MLCSVCGAPGMLTYSPRRGWKQVCVKCGGETEARAEETAYIAQEAGVQAQIGFSAFVSQDFGRAERCFQEAVKLCGDAPEYLWAQLLARYGVRYCKTPVCRGTAYEYTVNYWKKELPQVPMRETQEYEALCDCAGLCGSEWSQYYRKESEQIDAGLRQIAELERKGEVYDIFICFKNNDEAGEQTPEKRLLDLIYPNLIAGGVRVFYAPQTMEGRSRENYEGVIYNALKTARMLVIVASAVQNVESQWVESEWGRYLNWDEGRQKRVLTCTVGDMGPAQFPYRLRSIQSSLHAERIDVPTARWFASEILRQYENMQRNEEHSGGVHAAAEQGYAAEAAGQPQVRQEGELDRGKPEMESSAERAPAKEEWTPEELFQKGNACLNDEEAVRYYRMAAGRGYAPAQYSLGVCCEYGKGVSQNEAEAVKWYQEAAEQGHAEAQVQLGLCYSSGRGVPKDEAEAARWYRAAAEQGHAEAQVLLSMCYSLGTGVPEEDAEAVKQYRAAAKQGHAEAQVLLGTCYSLGIGVSEDRVEAAKWYRTAAEQGNGEAQCQLGNCYYWALGVPEDKAKAVEWYRAAAEQGYAAAQRKLGQCYHYGQGVEEDMEEAVGWYQAAAKQGDAEAQCQLGNYYCFVLGTLEDEAKAVEWYRAAAEQGNEEAQRDLGSCYHYGWGTEKNMEKAAKWYRAAAEQGDSLAQEYLDEINRKA